MNQRNITKVLENTKTANAILRKAGGLVLKSSFNTAKQVATLYKDAGVKAFGLGKEVLTKTVELTWTNQKKILKTSGNAIKEAAQQWRDGAEPELKTMTNARAKKAGKRVNKRSKKKELSIDDLLD